MKLIIPSGGQAVYHDFIAAATTWVPAKRINAAFVVDTWLDQERLDRAAWRVIAAHDSLRTSIERIDSVLFQLIQEPAEITGRVTEAIEWDGTHDGIRRIIADLGEWWTMSRAFAIKVIAARSPAPRRTLLLCAFNHACSDGISAELVCEQIRRQYEQDTPSRVPAVQFADYYAAMLDDGLRVALDDWIELLDRVQPAVPPWMLTCKLATDWVQMGQFIWSFNDDTVALLREAARSYLSSHFEILAAAVGIYFRRPDQRPAAIGVVHSGRHRPGGFEVVGLLRGFIVDSVEIRPDATTGEAVVARRDALRSTLAHFARLPFEEVCRRTGRSPGWRAGTLGQWEVELNGTFAPATRGSMDGCALREADVSKPEETWCENGGPTLVVRFTIGRDGVAAKLRYVRPPVDRELAARVGREIEETVQFIHSNTGEPVDRAPAFHRTAGWSG